MENVQRAEGCFANWIAEPGWWLSVGQSPPRSPRSDPTDDASSRSLHDVALSDRTNRTAASGNWNREDRGNESAEGDEEMHVSGMGEGKGRRKMLTSTREQGKKNKGSFHIILKRAWY